ncbi:hypothetical protein C365_06499 [Cryptococcus neoformans Bt85]|nr:hypothetical protein C365_06499 [Cryptococcus neoformans var. grubii Bt85]
MPSKLLLLDEVLPSYLVTTMSTRSIKSMSTSAPALIRLMLTGALVSTRLMLRRSGVDKVDVDRRSGVDKVDVDRRSGVDKVDVDKRSAISIDFFEPTPSVISAASLESAFGTTSWAVLSPAAAPTNNPANVD